MFFQACLCMLSCGGSNEFPLRTGTALSMLSTLSLGEWPRLPFTARIERALFHRARSASKKGTWPLPSTAGGLFQHPARGRSALDDYIACDFATRPEGFLRFAIEFGFDAPGVAKRQDKLVLAFPSGLFTRPEQGLLGTAAIDLNDDPTQLCRLKVQRQLFVRCSRPFE